MDEDEYRGAVSGRSPAPRHRSRPRDCPLCPRLVAFREHWREREPAWHNAPVATFGAPDGRLLIVGLAPGLRGANRTGRPFTGDYAGELLYATLLKFGFACGRLPRRSGRRAELVDAAIANAVRCVPPENKPSRRRSRTCRQFLAATIRGAARAAGDRGARPHRA